MVNIKAIYKGQPMYGILDYFKVGKEYSSTNEPYFMNDYHTRQMELL